MIRILHVVGKMDRGGTESMLMSYYRHIDRTSLQFDFVVHTTEHCDFEDEILSLGGKILRVPRFTFINLYEYKTAWERLFNDNPDYSILHVHHFLVAGIILPIAAKHEVRKRIVHSHNTKPPIFILKERVMWLFHHNLIKYSTDRLACSYDAGTYLFGKRAFVIFNNAIETEKYQFNEVERCRIRREFSIDKDAFVVGHIGSFRTKQKNHHFIVDIFASIVRQIPSARLLLIGTGRLQEEISQKILSLGLKNHCVFAGVREDVPSLLSAMDVFLFPSFFEGFGIVGIEAQASGLPVVASRAIPKEAVLTDLMVQLDLSAPLDDWVNTVTKSSVRMPRESYSEVIAQTGYGVKQNIEKLLKVYGI